MHSRIAIAWVLVAGCVTGTQTDPQPAEVALAPPAAVSSAPPPAPLPAASAPAREEPWSCDEIRMGYCTGAAAWAAGCGGIDGDPTTMLVPEVVARLGPCLAARAVGDGQCADHLQGCVREAVMKGARPTAKETEACRTLLAVCAQAGQQPNYDADECEHILAASTDGASRRQVEAALGPSSPEPSKCNAQYLWPNMPFTPYFGRGGS